MAIHTEYLSDQELDLIAMALHQYVPEYIQQKTRELIASESGKHANTVADEMRTAALLRIRIHNQFFDVMKESL